MSNFYYPMVCSLPGSSVRGISQARILEWVTISSPGDLSSPGVEPRSPALQADSLPSEPQGKPKNTGMGSLSLLQGIFPTQESTRGLLQVDSLPAELSEKLHSISYLIYIQQIELSIIYPNRIQKWLKT